MTDIEKRTLAAVLEFTEANHCLITEIELWGKPGFSRHRADVAQTRATRAREHFHAVSDEYRTGFTHDASEAVAS